MDDPTWPSWGPSELRATADEVRTRSAPWDLLVVGGGITGAGIARDAAMRGLDVLLLEARDVAFGTSSRSTRLIHGGVRYLEQGEFGLVYEALRERARLYAMAGHLVRPARFLFPAYRGDRLGPWKLRLGLTLYDTLNFHRGESHVFLPPDQCRAIEPLLAEQGLKGGVQYEDAVTDDARLTLTVLQDARRHGAEVLTYAPVQSIEPGEGGLHRVTLDDGTHITSRQTIVATGPWTSGKLLGTPGEGLLAKSKGIHIVMRAADVPVRHPVVIQAPEQRRILFVVPWVNRTYLGTTDTPFTGDPGSSGVTEADERELLELVGRLLPGAVLDFDRVVSAWSGVRPLVRESSSGGGDTVEMSRRHRVVENEFGVLGLVGGKLTTYRSMAEDAVDRVVARLGRTKTVKPCETHRMPLVPGRPLSGKELGDPLFADLDPRHGPASRMVARRVESDSALSGRLVDDLPYRWCEVDQAIQCEGVTHLVDVLRRRLPLALTDPDLGARVARPIAQRLVDAWGGNASDVDEELERYQEEVRVETRRTPRLD